MNPIHASDAITTSHMLATKWGNALTLALSDQMQQIDCEDRKVQKDLRAAFAQKGATLKAFAFTRTLDADIFIDH